MNRTVPAIAAVLATLGIVAAATPALAASEENQTVIVSTSDLDMASPAHRARLKSRVGRAADRVCGANDARGLFAYRAYRNCRDAAIRGALGE